MDAPTQTCPGCGAEVPDQEGPTHAVIGAPPGCWHLFREVVAREYRDPVRWPVHGWSVDTYAVQHPGRPGPRQAKSVATHLVGLCIRIERDIDGAEARQVHTRLVDRRRDFPWLPPPPSSAYPLTVRDVLAAPDPDAHREVVRRWAATTWEAWAEHHDTVRALLVIEQ